MRMLIETKDIFLGENEYKILIYEDLEEMKYYASVDNTAITLSSESKSALNALIEKALFNGKN